MEIITRVHIVYTFRCSMRLHSGYELLSLLTQIGLNVVMAVAVGAYIGLWLDKQLTTGVVFTLLGTVAGIGGALWSVYNTIEGFFRERNGEHNE
ncbi:MAG: AtpZ/AtpI family protein [Thermaerobacter sp.]|nr:AtpZ/AtpI family protein [Thermaerobacter sp.]